MKKIILSAVYVVLITNCLSAQNLNISDYSQNYFTLKANAEHYLDSLHNFMPDSLFYHEGSEYGQFKEWEELWEPRIGSSGDFDIYFQHLKIAYQNNNSASRSTSYDPSWEEIGPIDKPSGIIPYNGSQSAGIGPIEFVHFFKGSSSTDPLNNNMICGSTNGGLFYSNDAGINWVNSGTDFWSGSPNVPNAVFKVDDPEVVYAVSCIAGNDNEPHSIKNMGGVFRAKKNGIINPNTQWENIFDYNTLNVGVDCVIRKLLTDPANPDVLYVATSVGLFKSSNVNAIFPIWDNVLPDNIFDVEIHPGLGNHETLYVSFNAPSANSNSVQYSTSGGSVGSWNTFANLPSYSTSQISKISIETSDAFPDNIYLYYYGWGSKYKKLFKYSYDKNIVDVQYISNIDLTGLNFGNGNAFAVSQVGIDEIIFIANNDRYTKYFNGGAIGYSNQNLFHADMEGFTFNPYNENEIWMACHGGVYKSSNAGNNWAPSMHGIGVAMAAEMATSYKNPQDILIGTYHDGDILTNGIYTNNNWNPQWKYACNADGGSVIIDNIDPNYMYGTGNDPFWFRTTNGGLTVPFSVISSSSFPAEGFGSKGVLNKVQTNIMYSKQVGEVICSYNIKALVPSYKKISNLKGKTGNIKEGVYNIFSSIKDKDLLFAKFRNYNKSNSGQAYWELYYTLNASKPSIDLINDWHLLNCSNTNEMFDVKEDPVNPNTIYITFFPNTLYKVTDFTTNPVFTDLTSNLPYVPISAIEVEKGSDGGIYLASDVGIYYTNNKLRTLDPNNAWIKFGESYPHVTTNHIEINYEVNKLRADAYGRGIWQADLYCPADNTLNETVTYTTDNFIEASSTITSTATVNSGLNITYRAGDEITLSLGFIAKSGSNFRAFIHGCNHSGNSFKSYTTGGTLLTETENDNSFKETPQITISPNPNDGTFQVSVTKNEKPIGIKEIKVYDIMGKVIWQTGASQNSVFTIDISNYSQGIYYVKSLNDSGEIEVKKFIKE